MKLNLGSNDDIREGYLNVDLIEAPGIDFVWDLRNYPWPWDESWVEHILAQDVIEHLPDKIKTMNELWRVLCPGGTVLIAVPTTDGPGAFQDPTHVSFWNRNSFHYFEYQNYYRDRFAKFYGIQAAFKIAEAKTTPSRDGPRLTILLRAMK